jgi:hypothetical protein
VKKMHRTVSLALVGAFLLCSRTYAVDAVISKPTGFVAGQELPVVLKAEAPKTKATRSTGSTDIGKITVLPKDGVRATMEIAEAKAAETFKFVAGKELPFFRSGGSTPAKDEARMVDIKVPMEREETYTTASFYSEYYDHVVRWQDGHVKIYDNTGFSRWDVVLERLQPFMGKVTLVMARDEASADIVIDAVDTMPTPHEQSCGVTQNYIGKDNASITKARTKIRKIQLCIGDGKDLHLYMHELGHALGFARHSKDDDVMAAYADKESILRIPTLSRFLTGTYGLDVGAPFPTKDFYSRVAAPTAWSVADGSVQAEAVAHERVAPVTDAVVTKARVQPSAKPQPKVEEVVEYKPMATATGTSMRAIQVIGPTGMQTIWVTTPVTPEPKAAAPRRR